MLITMNGGHSGNSFLRIEEWQIQMVARIERTMLSVRKKRQTIMVRGDDRVARDIEDLMIELKNIELIKSRTKAIAGSVRKTVSANIPKK